MILLLAGLAAAADPVVTVLPVPTVDVTPETGLALGAVALCQFRPLTDARASTAKIEATVTLKQQLILDTGWEVFFPADRWLWAGSVAGTRYPEQFWGVGPDTPDTPEGYDAWRIEGSTDVLRRPWRSLFIGPTYSYQWMFNVTPTPGGRLDVGGITGADGGVSSGLGYVVAWDDRASTAHPNGGSRLLSIRQVIFGPGVGSDFSFTRYSLDGRLYLTTWRDHVLALQGVAVLHTGDPPFRMLALLGGDMITRGYYYGRYRDQHLFATQAEYRASLFGRIGAVGFMGFGEVTPRLDVHTAVWPTVGAGVRVRVTDDPINLRLDYAQGAGSSAVYFGFGETF